MKKQNLLFIPLILSLCSCNFADGGNEITYQNVPAVVWESGMGGTTIGVAGTILSAPPSYDVDAGDCVWLHQFTIDYDNQPSNSYLTVTNVAKDRIEPIVYNDIEQLIGDPIEQDEYTLPLSIVRAWADPYYRGRFFVMTSCGDKNPTVRLIYNPEEEEINGVKTIYIQAKPSSSSLESTNFSKIHVFDLQNLIYEYGQEGSYNSSENNIIYVKADLKYLENSEWKKAVNMLYEDPSKPFEISFFID